MTQVIRVNFTDINPAVFYEGQSQTDTAYFEIDEDYINQIPSCYDVLNTMWNGGDSYETYLDYCSEWGEDAMIESHFDELRHICSTYSWQPYILSEVVNCLYPDAQMTSTLDHIRNFDFEY